MINRGMSIYNGVNILIGTFPTILVFLIYNLLLFFWIELMYSLWLVARQLHHSANSGFWKVEFFRYLRAAYVCLALTIILQFLVLVLLDSFLYNQSTTVPLILSPIDQIIWVWNAMVAYMTGAGFLLAGFALVIQLARLRSWGLLSKFRRRLMIKIFLISVVCSVAFLTRASLDLVASLFNPAVMNSNPFYLVAFFVCLELIPIGLIYFVLQFTDPSVRQPMTVESDMTAPPILGTVGDMQQSQYEDNGSFLYNQNDSVIDYGG